MFRSSDVRPWVAHAATVSLSLAIFIGFGVYWRESLTGQQASFANEVFTGCKWAAISCAVVAGPVTGALAQTSLERVLGTIIGGFCGFLVCWMATPVATAYEWTVYALMAGAFGWAAVYMGHRLSLNYSFKLAIITFLLVFAGADDLEEARTIAFTRTLGIVAGVTMTLILSVSILPVSAHHQHDEALNKALRALLSLQALCWLPLTHAHEAHVPSFLSPTTTAQPQLSKGPLPNESSPQPSIHADHGAVSDADMCTAPLISPRSPPHTSPNASPQRSGQITPDSVHEDPYTQGAGTGPSLSAGASSVGVTAACSSQLGGALSASYSAPPNTLPNVSQQGHRGPWGQFSAQDREALRRSSLGGCASSGRGSHAGLVKRSEFASVNWEMHNLKLNEEGDIRSAEDIVVEVYSALSAAEASLAISEREIYAGRIFGRPFYIPRFVASILCLGGKRSVPTKQAKAACGAARGAARVLLALHSLLKEGTDSVVKEVLHERYPGALMPDVVKFSGFAIQDCIEAFDRGSPVCGSSLELLRTTVATLISISGAHRSRIHHQYQTYRAVAHDLRARLYARSSASRPHTSSNQSSINAQQGWGGVFASFISRGAPPNPPSLTLSSPGGNAGAAAAAAAAARPPRHSGGLDGPSGKWGRKVWRAISGRLSASFGRSAPVMSGSLTRAADEEGGVTQALLQVRTDRDRTADGAESPSDNSNPSDEPRMTSPFSSLQGQEGLMSPDAMRLSFSVLRSDPPRNRQNPESIPAAHSSEAHADESHTPRQLSGGLTTKPSQSTNTSQLTTPDGAATSAQTSRVVSQGVLLASQHQEDGGNTRNASTPPFNLSPRDPPPPSYSHNGGMSLLPEKEHNASLGTLPTLSIPPTGRQTAQEHLQQTPRSSSTLRSTDSSPPAPIHGHRMADVNMSALSSVAFPSHRQSLTDSFIEGEQSENRIFSTRDSFMHTDDVAYASTLTSASPLLPPAHAGKVPSPHGGHVRSHPQVGSQSLDAPLREACTVQNSRTSHADLGAFGSAVGVAEADKVPSQVNLLFPQSSGMTDASLPHGRMKPVAAPLPRTFSAGASKAGASAATPHAFGCTGSANLPGSMPSGDLGDAQRLLARSGTQPLLMFPDTLEGYYAEITYYTFQFHLEEIVDATEELQSTLCDLIRAMPRNAANFNSTTQVRI